LELVAVNIGEPRPIDLGGREVLTAILKQPVSGRVRVKRLGIEGDHQADLKNHGGVDQAVYAYPIEHYDFWREELGGRLLPDGQFGENLTLRGLLEEGTGLGDVLRVGTARLQVSQPRIPCAKLAHHIGAGPDFPRRFLASRRLGFYLRVLEEGEIGAGDPIEIVEHDEGSVSVAELIEISQFQRDDAAGLKRVLASRGLSGEWTARLEKRLGRLEPR
jgi:MOSC domain-containing protein YiiM